MEQITINIAEIFKGSICRTLDFGTCSKVLGKKKQQQQKGKEVKPRNLLSMNWQKYVCLLKYFNAFPPPPEPLVRSIPVFPLEIKRGYKLYAYVLTIEHLTFGNMHQ